MSKPTASEESDLLLIAALSFLLLLYIVYNARNDKKLKEEDVPEALAIGGKLDATATANISS